MYGNCRLLDVEVVLDRRTNKDRIRQYALICSEQCYVIRQVDDEPSNVVQRIPYKHLKLMQPVAVSEHNATFASIGLFQIFSEPLSLFSVQ